MNALLTIRKISNGYLVSIGDPYKNTIIGQQEGEVFYPSEDALLGDARDLLQASLTTAAAARDRYEADFASQRQALNDSAQFQISGSALR